MSKNKSNACYLEEEEKSGSFRKINNEWCNSLKLGDMVDVVPFDDAFDLKAWSKGKVDNIIVGYGCNSGNLGDEKGLGVKSFIIGDHKDLSVRPRLVRADELIIAPYNSKTSADTWRENLFKAKPSRLCLGLFLGSMLLLWR